MFAILLWQLVATVTAHQLPKLSELSQQEVFTDLMGHPVSVVAVSGKNKIFSLVNVDVISESSPYGPSFLTSLYKPRPQT